MSEAELLMKIEVSFNDGRVEKHFYVKSYEVSTKTLAINKLEHGILRVKKLYPLEEIINIETSHGLDDET